MLLGLLALPASVEGYQTPNNSVLSPAERATVHLIQTYDLAGSQAISCIGSGTVVNSSGLILTNAHLAIPGGSCRGEKTIVALATSAGSPPVPTFVAEVSQIDLTHDIAILQISGGLDGSPIDPASLNLPFVNVADPSGILPGNTLTFVGFQRTEAASVASIEGQVTGITTEKSGSRFSWLRTSTVLDGTMAGGGAYDANGLLVGMLTSAPGTDGITPASMCRLLQDNNADGLITESDACVPVGAPVSAIRPVNFAAPLLESARNGFSLAAAEGNQVEPPVTGDPALSRLYFSTNVDANGNPTKIVSSLPSQQSSLYLFFDYSNMRPGTPYELQVSRDGITMAQISLGPLAWGGYDAGTWYIGAEDFSYPDGVYNYTLLVNGEIAASASIEIGAPAGEPTFSELKFHSDAETLPNSASATLLPAGIPQINVDFAFANMVEGQDWREVWYLDGSTISDITRLWDGGVSGNMRVNAINYEGLPLGRYRLELYIGSRLAGTGEVVLAGSSGPQDQAAIFSGTRLAAEITREGAPGGQIVQSGGVLPLGSSSLYTFVNWDRMPGRMTWTYRWFLDGRLVGSSSQKWTAGGVGEDFWIRIGSNDSLPEGLYAVEVLVENTPLFSANVAIGSGTQPQQGVEELDDVFVSGRIVDALTGQGIPGAMVIVLEEQYESPQFTWDESQIHAEAIADRDGRFRLLRGLPRGPLGSFYTVYVLAEGYTTIVEDTFWILRAYEQQIEILIEMNRP